MGRLPAARLIGGDIMKGRTLRAFLVERDGPHCHWCGRMTFDPVEVGDTADEAQTIDHLDTRQPRRSVRDPARAVVACSRCNRDRGCLTVEEWQAVLKVRKASAPRRSGGFGFYAVLAVALVWWAPTLVMTAADVGFIHFETWWLVRRARRLRLAGRLEEALAMLERAEARNRARGGGRGA